MTTKTEQAPAIAGNVQMIPLMRLVPTKDNPRVMRKDQAFAELVESVKHHGILQPPIARPMPGEESIKEAGRTYDLRCGHRRLAAARKAGLAEMPVIVAELDDKAAMEITVIENMARQDLQPLEESAAVRHLLDVGWAVTEIADRMGKTPGWISRRAKLQDLSPAWRKEVADSRSEASLWPATLLERIARLPVATQDEVLKDLDGDNFRTPWPYCDRHNDAALPTAAQLDGYLAGEILHTLAAAPWKLDDETLYAKAGSCAACQKRSSCEPLLFEGLDEAAVPKGKKAKPVSGDRCLDLACFKEKGRLFTSRKLAEVKAEHGSVIPVSNDHHYGTDLKKLEQKFPGLVSEGSVSMSVTKVPGAKPAVMIEGPRAGHQVWVSPPRQYGGSQTAKAKKQEGKPAPLKDRREDLQRRRMAHVITAIRAKLDGDGELSLPEKLRTPVAAAALAIAFGTDDKREFADSDKTIWRHGKQKRVGSPWTVLKDHLATTRPTEPMLAAELIECILPVLDQRLAFQNGERAAKLYPEARKVCALLEIDIKALEATAATEIPEPRGWASLKEDGTVKGTEARTKGKAKAPKPSKAAAEAKPPGKGKRTKGTASKAKKPASACVGDCGACNEAECGEME